LPSTPLPDFYEFFVDECVSARHVSRVLREAGYVAHVQGPETFGTGTLDVEWLPQVGARGWVLITKDQNIRKRPLELRALVASGVRAFVLTSGGLRGEEQGRVFRQALPAMLRLLRRQPPPFVARVTAAASVELIPVAQRAHRG
jgi:predicted nuclease of predicted toxin-antitoxin system